MQKERKSHSIIYFFSSLAVSGGIISCLCKTIGKTQICLNTDIKEHLNVIITDNYQSRWYKISLGRRKKTFKTNKQKRKPYSYWLPTLKFKLILGLYIVFLFASPTFLDDERHWLIYFLSFFLFFFYKRNSVELASKTGSDCYKMDTAETQSSHSP